MTIQVNAKCTHIRERANTNFGAHSPINDQGARVEFVVKARPELFKGSYKMDIKSPDAFRLRQHYLLTFDDNLELIASEEIEPPAELQMRMAPSPNSPGHNSHG